MVGTAVSSFGCLHRRTGRVELIGEPRGRQRCLEGCTSPRARPAEGSMNLGRVSSAALMLSGISGVLTPRRVASALELSALSPRGVAETRAGLGGTYAALGAWALVSRDPAARIAVGVTWLGAAAARLGALAVDEPETDATYWAYLAAELGLGTAAIASARRQGRP